MADGDRDGRATLEDVFDVLRATDLEPEHKVLWGIYRSYEGSDGNGAFPGDELLARHLGRSPRTVRRYRKELREAGWLEQELRGPKPARYRAVVPNEQDVQRQEGEETPTWGDELPAEVVEADSFPVQTFRAGVLREWYRVNGELPDWNEEPVPPDAPDGWSIQADLGHLRDLWERRPTEEVARYVRGVRALAEADALPGIEPGDPFSAAYAMTSGGWDGQTLWSRALGATDGVAPDQSGRQTLDALSEQVLAEKGAGR